VAADLLGTRHKKICSILSAKFNAKSTTAASMDQKAEMYEFSNILTCNFHQVY